MKFLRKLLHRRATLDDLAKDYSPGEIIRFKIGKGERRGEVLGFVYSLPLYEKGPKHPALIVRDVLYPERLGHVYPFEVIS